MAGRFAASVLLEGDPAETAAFGETDVLIVRYDANGDHQWHTVLRGEKNAAVVGIGLDGNGNVYLAGSYHGPLTLGSLGAQSYGQQDVFVAKLGADGTEKWVHGFGSPSPDGVYGFAVSDAGLTTVGGDYTATVAFEDGTALFLTHPRAAFLVRIDAAGDYEWRYSLDTASSQSVRAITMDGLEAGYLAGTYEGALSFGGQEIDSPTAGEDVFVMRLDLATHEPVWLVRAVDDVSLDGRLDVASLAGGGAALSGTFTGTATFGGKAVTADQRDGFVMRRGASGELRWSTVFGGPGDQIVADADFDAEGALFVTGSFGGTTLFGDVEKTPVQAPAKDVFVLQLAP
ncbi:MAG: hypothetical protein R3F14_16910 [Polyangiaceae bacterium]